MKKLLSLIAFVFTAQLTFAQATPDSLKAYVVQALDIMKENSINKYKVDWEDLYAQTLKEAQDAKTITGTYPAIQFALLALNDGHSKFFTKEVFDAHNVGYNAMGYKIPFPAGHIIDGAYGYISVPAFAVFDVEEQLMYVDSLQAIIRKLDAQNPKGWIIDLRLNDGGNMHPLLAGLAPILGEGKLLGWQTADNNVTYSTHENGVVLDIHGNEHAIAQPYIIRNRKAPVSVLVSSKTASSAEMVAAAFIGRPKTKLIGTYTGQLTTNNDLFILPDGACLILTTSTLVDRTGKVYGKGITPAIELSLTQSATTNSYLYISAAIKHIENPRKR